MASGFVSSSTCIRPCTHICLLPIAHGAAFTKQAPTPSTASRAQANKKGAGIGGQDDGADAVVASGIGCWGAPAVSSSSSGAAGCLGAAASDDGDSSSDEFERAWKRWGRRRSLAEAPLLAHLNVER